MNTPPPLTKSTCANTAEKLQPSFASQAATVSFAAPFLGMGVNIVSQPIIGGDRAAMMIVGCLAILFILGGFVLGIVALAQTKKQGRKGIFGKAIAGICINGLLIGLMLISIPSLIKATERAKEVERRRLEQQQQMSSAGAIVERVRMEVAAILKKESTQIDITKSLAEQGADELDIVEIVMAVEEVFNVEIPDSAIDATIGENKTLNVQTLAGIVSRQQRTK